MTVVVDTLAAVAVSTDVSSYDTKEHLYSAVDKTLRPKHLAPCLT